MRILHVITSLRTGGAEKLMVDLLPRLKAKGHEVDLLLFYGTDTPFRRAAEEAGIKVLDLGKGGSVYSPLRLLKLIPYLKKYDIIHTHNTAPQLFAAIGSIFNSATLYTRTQHFQPPSQLEVVCGGRPLDVLALSQGNLHLAEG